MTRSYIDLSPTPEEWQRARELQAERNSIDEHEAERIADSLIRDCRNAGYVDSSGNANFHDFLVNTAKDNPVTPDPEAKPFAFWSFESQENSMSAVVEHRYLAQACAEARGLNVLETTESGQRLDSYRLFDPKVKMALDEQHGISESRLKPARKEAWKNLSRSYTEAARGDTLAFAVEVSENSVLGRDELPELRNNPEVGSGRIKFALPIPEQRHLSDDVRSLLEHDEVRASLVMQDYDENGPDSSALRVEGLDSGTKAPHFLAHKLEQADLPPELAAQRDDVVERLRSVDSFSGLRESNASLMADRMDSSLGRGVGELSRGGPGTDVDSGNRGQNPGLPPVQKGIPSVGNLVHSGRAFSESSEGRGSHSPRHDGRRPEEPHSSSTSRSRGGNRGRRETGPGRGD